MDTTVMDTMVLERSTAGAMVPGSVPGVGRLRRRLPAFVVDWTLVLLAGLVAALPGGVVADGAPAGSVAYVLGSVASWLGFVAAVPGYWLASWRWLDGRSVAQWLLGLRVLRTSGGRPSAARLLGRELGLKLVAQAVSGGLWLSVGALVALSDTRRRGLHDRVVDTVVVREAGGVQRRGPVAPSATNDQMIQAEAAVGDGHAGA